MQGSSNEEVKLKGPSVKGHLSCKKRENSTEQHALRLTESKPKQDNFRSLDLACSKIFFLINALHFWLCWVFIVACSLL